jgi:hypothetical protein
MRALENFLRKGVVLRSAVAPSGLVAGSSLIGDFLSDYEAARGAFGLLASD